MPPKKKNKEKKKATSSGNLGQGSAGSSTSQQQSSTSRSIALDTSSQPVLPASATPDIPKADVTMIGDTVPRCFWCIIDEQTALDIFSVHISEPADPLEKANVDHLKNAINEKLKRMRASKDLTLWRVAIPIPDDDEVRIVLNNVDEKMKKKLRPSDDISDVYPGNTPRKTIRVIVQLPPPDPIPARDKSRSSSPTQHISVPQDDIDKELAIILKGIHHDYVNHSLDPEKLEMSQKEQLKSFFKRTLPYDQSPKDISLVMLGLQLSKQASTAGGKTLLSIVEDDIGKTRGFHVVAMVAPSGSGKTATVFDLATKHFVIYCVCSTPRATVSADFNDVNFISLAKDVEKMYMSVVDEEQGDQLGIDFKIKARAGERVELEILARLLFLQLLLVRNPALEQLQFFREQTTTGGVTIGVLVNKLREYDTLTIQAMLRATQTNIHLHLLPQKLGLVIALDEAQSTDLDILAGKLISPTALIENRGNEGVVIFDGKEIRPKFRRGFLTPLTATLSGMRATIVILGTALSLQNADHVYSALGKATNIKRITNFPQLDESDVKKMISDLVDLSGCDIPPAKRRKLSGRPRFSLGIINRLIANPTQISKQDTLDSAIDQTIEHLKRDLRDGVQKILDSDKTGESSRLLCRMVLAYHLHGSKISFSSTEQGEFVNKALCKLRVDSDGVHLIMDEPIVIEAVEEELITSGKDSALSEYLHQLYQIVTNFGVASTSKGDALELLVRRSLQRFNGFPLVDLPFLKDISLPKWCNDLKLQIDQINTANGFGYIHSGTASDLAFLTERPSNKMLVAKYGTRPDGAWFFSDNQYAGSLAIKFYSSSVPQKKHKENKTSSDVRACFLQKDGTTSNPTLEKIRSDLVTAWTSFSLRASQSTGDDMVQLKKVIRLICQKK